jgi:Ubiquitin family
MILDPNHMKYSALNSFFRNIDVVEKGNQPLCEIISSNRQFLHKSIHSDPKFEPKKPKNSAFQNLRKEKITKKFHDKVSNHYEELSCLSHRRQSDWICFDCKSRICSICSMDLFHLEHSVDFLSEFELEVDEIINKLTDIQENLDFYHDELQFRVKQYITSIEHVFSRDFIKESLEFNEKITKSLLRVIKFYENNSEIINSTLDDIIKSWYNSHSIMTGFEILSREIQQLVEFMENIFGVLLDGIKADNQVGYERAESLVQSIDSYLKSRNNGSKSVGKNITVASKKSNMEIEYLQVFVQAPSKLIILELEKDRRVLEMKEKIQKILRIPVWCQVLIFGNCVLQNDCNFSGYGIKNYSKIYLKIRSIKNFE